MTVIWHRVMLAVLLGLGSATTAFAQAAVKIPQLPMPESLFPAQPAVIGYVSAPAGEGPFPGVVLLHGSGGLERDTRGATTWHLLRDYADRYRQRGYVALILDSHTPRGQSNLAAVGSDTLIPYAARAWDAAAGAAFLVAHHKVRKDRIVVQGLSSGGTAILHALNRGPLSPPRGIFAAGIAWYPRCEPSFRTPGFYAPLLILAGGKDTWTPVEQCQRIIDSLDDDDPQPARMQVYPDATHAYDYPDAHGFIVGYRVSYSWEATRASWEEIDAFLDRHMR